MTDITSTNINETKLPDGSGSIIFSESIKSSIDNSKPVSLPPGSVDAGLKPQKKKMDKQASKVKTILSKVIHNEVWLSVSEAAKIGGVQSKTIRRAIQAHSLKYKVVGNRYSINLASLVLFLFSKKKLKNKLEQYGIGQYIKEWSE